MTNTERHNRESLELTVILNSLLALLHNIIEEE